MWLIPVAIVMKERGYISQVIELHRQYLNEFPVDTPLKTTWNNILDKTVKDTLRLEIDPKFGKRELNIFCKNLTNYQLNKVLLKIIVKYKDNAEKSFLTQLLQHGRIYEKQEKQILVVAPTDISFVNVESIQYRIMQIDFLK